MNKVSLPSDANASGRSFGQEELDLLKQVIDSGILNCTKGTMVSRFEKKFAELVGTPFCRCTTSGTAAIHAAIAGVNPEPGDEVISTPITDMGAITPILYQAAIPVFADVDPHTYNVTAETIRRKITRRTKAVVVTHLFGNPCEMDPIVELCKKRDLVLIEDCAQAYGTTYRGKQVGTFGAVGCFSLQQGKHMTTGEGGMVVSADPVISRRMQLFIDKAWGYGDPNPDHYFLALNYRMTELAGAVALAQIDKLAKMIEQRVAMASLLTDMIRDLPGVHPPTVRPHAKHTYWKFPLRIEPRTIAGGADAFGQKLRDAGVFCVPRYIQKPAFECAVLRDRNTFGKSRFPYEGEQRKGEPPVVYDVKDTPGTAEGLSTVVVLPWNEKYTREHVEYIAAAIRGASGELAKKAS